MKNKKVLIIIIISLVVVMLAVGGALAYFYVKGNKDISFKLIGDKEITINLNDDYDESGYTLIVNGKKATAIVDNQIDNTKIGTYKVIYSFKDKFNKTHKLVRKVTVVDKEAPVITLNGNKEVTILISEEFIDTGYKVKDNYDDEDSIKVEVTDDIKDEVGTYTVIYKACDSSKNCSEETRTVNVIEPIVAVVYTEPKIVEIETTEEDIIVNVDNTVTGNKFTSTGIYLEGYITNSDVATIFLKNGDTSLEYPMNKNGDYYNGSINLENVANGTYKAYINNEELINNMATINKIVRAKVGNKLVTVNYDNNVSIIVEDFAYQYDILIDVGHGGYDVGATNAYAYEKNMNLTVSKYEKCRYEEMGLTVLMVRNDDTYGSMMGDSSWKDLTKRGYFMGYYGAVSKIVYSNHHNSSVNKNARGYEILTPAQFTSLTSEIAIASSLNNLYPSITTSHTMYARDYETGAIYPSTSGQSYNFRNYYCVIRVPYELFNTKVVIYEGAYMSNLDDFNWYWTDGNWKKVSEVKIKEYVTSLGYTYSETTTCS